MAYAGFITDAQAKAAIAQPARLARSRIPLPSARYFADWVVDEVYQLVGRNHGDLTVVTTLDSRAQGEAERAVDRVMDRDGDKPDRSEEHTSELQYLMRSSSAVFRLTKK